jgi:hypothetical protein
MMTQLHTSAREALQRLGGHHGDLGGCASDKRLLHVSRGSCSCGVCYLGGHVFRGLVVFVVVCVSGIIVVNAVKVVFLSV